MHILVDMKGVMKHSMTCFAQFCDIKLSDNVALFFISISRFLKVFNRFKLKEANCVRNDLNLILQNFYIFNQNNCFHGGWYCLPAFTKLSWHLFEISPSKFSFNLSISNSSDHIVTCRTMKTKIVVYSLDPSLKSICIWKRLSDSFNLLNITVICFTISPIIKSARQNIYEFAQAELGISYNCCYLMDSCCNTGVT